MGISSEVLSYDTEVTEPEARLVDDFGRLIEYQDWSPANSRVVSGPYGRGKFPGTHFPDKEAARAYWESKSQIVEELFNIPNRYIFRIKTKEIA